MTATYVAWNGKSYPSPPPDGWYEASDGRWWAPGTGPNPPKQQATAAAQPSAGPTSLAQRPQGAAAGAPATTAASTDAASNTVSNTGAKTVTPSRGAHDIDVQGSQPKVDLNAVAATAAAQRAQVLNSGQAEQPANALAEMRTSAAPRANPDPRTNPDPTRLDRTKPDQASLDRDHTAEFRVAVPADQRTVTRFAPAGTDVQSKPAGPTTSTPPAAPSTGPQTAIPPALQGPQPTLGNKPPVIAKKAPAEQGDGRSRKELALMALVAVALVAAVGFTVAALTGGADSTTAASTDSTSPDPADTVVTTTIEAPSTEAPSTEAADVTATSSPAETTTTLSDAERVAQFRDGLEDNQLSTDSLSDQDIVDFGQSFCLFAIVSTDGPDFETYRLRAIAESTTDLTPEELTVAIDQALASFCPQHAERLGLL